MCIVGMILTILSTIMGIHFIQVDEEFHIQLSRQERFLCVITDGLSCFLFYKLFHNGIDTIVLAFIGLVISYLLISAITDARFHMIYYGFLYLFLIGAFILDMYLAITNQKCSTPILGLIVLLAFSWISYVFHLYEKGDIALTFASGIVFYFLCGSAANAMICNCFVIFFAELAMLIHAKRKGLFHKGKLLKPMPLGPYLFGSFMISMILLTTM